MASDSRPTTTSHAPSRQDRRRDHDQLAPSGQVIARPRKSKVSQPHSPALPPASSPDTYLDAAFSRRKPCLSHRLSTQEPSSDIETSPQAASQHTGSQNLSMAPPPSAQGDTTELRERLQHGSQDMVSENGQLYSLEEWDSRFPVPKPAASEAKPSKPPVIVPLPAVPTTGEFTARFNHLCQVHSIIPSYTLQDLGPGCFAAKVEFDGGICEDPGPFPSKKQAKETVCRQACDVLENMAVPNKGKRKSVEEAAALQEENWVSQLMEFCQKQKHPLPVYKEYEAVDIESQRQGLITGSKQFACTIQIQAAPLQVFGSEEKLFPSKSPAKRNSAKEAVLWLRANGMFTALPTSKRQKASEASDSTGLTQCLSKLNTNQSLPQMVAERSLQLGFSQPMFEYHPSTPPPGAVVANFYTASARYLDRDVEREPRLQAPLCTTGNTYGQKNAKEECCRLLLGVLEGLVQERRDTMQ